MGLLPVSRSLIADLVSFSPRLLSLYQQAKFHLLLPNLFLQLMLSFFLCHCCKDLPELGDRIEKVHLPRLKVILFAMSLVLICLCGDMEKVHNL